MHKNYPFIPWIGGKRRLAKTILPLFPKHTCCVEPFCGAAALFFMKEPVEVEVLNDINGELVNMYLTYTVGGNNKSVKRSELIIRNF